nr:response regulator [Butyrivibrio sp.]
QIAEYANNIKTASNTLLSIINDVLDFSKIESGKMEIVPIEYELYGMINDLTTMIEDRARKKNLEFKLNINKDIPHILFGDELRIKQCILNILTNAVKYTEKGYFSLSINYRIEDNHNIILIIKVTDTGQGIKQEDIERLFVPFERIDEARNRTVEGTGLGMSIVQNLLYKMDSKLEVKSEYGKGSTFSFRIKQEVISWEPIGNFEDEFKKSMTETGSYHELFQAPDAKILFVDDTDMNHTVIKGLLKNTRIKIDSLMSGEEALEAVKKTKYDIIFLDHRMPGLDGVETLKAMNEMEDNINKAVPCIALTANVVSGAKEKYLSCGFADYMSKPVDSRKLEEMILALLPKEKIFIIKSNNENKDNMSDPNLTDKAFNDFLKYVPSDMDMNMALKNCGDIKTFTQVLVDFRKSAENRIEEIEDFYNEKNLSDYGIRVHALKSTARILGEKELSQRAEELENFANNNDYQSVEKNHKALIKCFNSTLIGIDFLMSHFDSDDTMRSKEIITEKRFREAEKGLYNLIENYDFDGADGIMEMLSEYDIPLSLKDRYNKIKKMMASVDRDGLMELLSDN